MITEIDGPPRGYFEVRGDNGQMLRYIYKSVRRRAATREALRAWYDQFHTAIQVELEQQASDDGIIWWRKRPTYEEIQTRRFKGFELYMRLDTSPYLSYDFWKQYAIDQNDATPVLPNG